MARDIRTKAHLQGGEIRTKANFGQTVTITVLPDPYEGQTTVTPSDERQTLPTRGKTVATDITVLSAPTESLATSENGTFTPSSGNVGFSEVVVDVEPSLESLSVTENGLYLPESGTDGFDRVSVDVPIPEPVLESLTVDSLTQHGTFLPAGDGFSQVTVEEDWDGTLYPITDETDPIYDSKPFDAHWVQLSAGDTIIIEGYGRGRWVGFRGITTTSISSLPGTVNIAIRSAPQFDYLRFRFDAVEDCIAVLAGTNGSREGTHSGTVGYCFCGDYLRWKVIHAS